MICSKCGNPIAGNAKFCNVCGTQIQATEQNVSSGMNFDFSTNTASPMSHEHYEYKVLSQKDKWFSGKFDPAILEQAMNSYAQQGWRVIGCATADIPGFGGNRQEFVTVLERKI